MARNYIGFTPRGPTVFRNIGKTRNGRPLLFIEENEITRLDLDFTGYLESGETVLGAAKLDDNITTSIAVSTPTVTLTVSESGAFGKTTVTVTTSSGNIWSDEIHIKKRIRRTDGAITTDYGHLS